MASVILFDFWRGEGKREGEGEGGRRTRGSLRWMHMHGRDHPWKYMTEKRWMMGLELGLE
jgi:hypothetical protein